jgi:hypothetical protein
MLRHTFVTTMLDAGVDLRDTQIAARHADPRTTMRYDRARTNLDRHPNYILAAYMSSGTRRPRTQLPMTAHRRMCRAGQRDGTWSCAPVEQPRRGIRRDRSYGNRQRRRQRTMTVAWSRAGCPVGGSAIGTRVR